MPASSSPTASKATPCASTPASLSPSPPPNSACAWRSSAVRRAASRQSVQTGAQRVGLGAVERLLHLAVRARPNRYGRREQGVTGRREFHQTTAAVVPVDDDLCELALDQRFQVGG